MQPCSQSPKGKWLGPTEPVNEREKTGTQAFSLQIQCMFSLPAIFVSKKETRYSNGLKGMKKREV